MKKINKIFIVLIFVLISGCGGTGIETSSNPNPSGNDSTGSGTQTTSASFANSKTFLGLFSLGSDFPPAIIIPDREGLRSTAFVMTFFPTAVLAFDLDSNPLALSKTFATFDASGISEAGFPNNLWIESPTRAYLLSSTHVVVFNPTTGQHLGSISLSNPINLTQALPYSTPGDCDGNGIPESSVGPGSYTPTFPAALAVLGNRLFVTMSNACFDASFESFYVQGILLAFDILDSSPFLSPASKPFVVLPGFNVTGITPLSDRLIVTSTGDTSLQGGNNIPETDSFLTELNPNSLSITNLLNLGKVAANFQALAVNGAQTRGYVGSAAFSEVYEINLDNFSILRGINNPIILFGGEDFISDQEMAFEDEVLMVSSFNHSAIRGIDLSTGDPQTLNAILDFSFTSNPGVTGAGPMALRPGQPGVDFQGSDLWILTSNPGTLSAATTY